MRVVALDLGTRRIGLAVSDPTGTVASPLAVVDRRGDREAEHTEVARWVGEAGAALVLVGLPLSLSGRTGPAARAALEEVEQLRQRLEVPVETADERFTTVTATRALRQSRRRRPERGAVDQAAAAVLLQAWLDGR
ncbi:MAG TPA: Holliday junction resolvase RuvX [Acidimicrobiales bacterium]|nr:Holliday junction resolvase RuvX [Acidimicrobiales bacterium]